MVRRRKTGVAEDRIDLISMLPWWAGIAMALVSYVLLHDLATLSFAAEPQPGQMALVQCKQWRALKVGVGEVRELCSVMAAQGAAGGVVMTSGRFTEEAVRCSGG